MKMMGDSRKGIRNLMSLPQRGQGSSPLDMHAQPQLVNFEIKEAEILKNDYVVSTPSGSIFYRFIIWSASWNIFRSLGYSKVYPNLFARNRYRLPDVSLAASYTFLTWYGSYQFAILIRLHLPTCMLEAVS